ncbi:(NiFe) hydrogenase maturation protein HypF [Thermincola ferriacetica]|uniref:Carbamoyltransferase n=1 Tax=Thermincola ferriacetica TaxID=281456 RepID=A0A0L6W719_9FIRM|nr:carbamoyltransferase HypF [Thermincola ferriacetica]KNZ71178.1 (NiFe) hydrogenase maturation protein HypF [Thermincola ferriacetica]
MRKRYTITVNGIVQGVGFRPFVYKLAERYGLSGEVANTTQGVIIDIEGEDKDIDNFMEQIKYYPPPLADVQKVDKRERELKGCSSFVIKHSQGEEEKQTLISPDVAICDDCLAELFNPSDRRYLYPFINCTNCGPRFTIIEDVPYDRPKTTMKCFPMCAQCLDEYENPADRRFHAQPNACPACGPQVFLTDRRGEVLPVDDPIRETAELLLRGHIIAIKGLGGYHLACDAKNEQAVRELRSRKYREDKPFAVMFKDVDSAFSYCHISVSEERLLKSIKRPIVLLKKKKESYDLAYQVAPENDFLGVLLPYTPLHYILFKYFTGPLVMTSANVSDEPIAYKDRDALERLAEIADYFLMHNREIRHRCDDSVTRIFRNREYLIRRSRGYAPRPILLQKQCKQILACGAEQKNTFCLTKGSYAFVSHHIGDLENLETLESFTEGIELYKRLFAVEPEIIAYDLHPEYLSTKYALQQDHPKKIGIQHHHAHIASCMAEHNLTGPVIGVAFDGTGYGTDGRIWGGEFLVADLKDFRRVAHLDYLPMPGGAKAIREPWRMAASYLLQLFKPADLEKESLPMVKKCGIERVTMLGELIDKQINSPLTSSMGRLFDAVSALLGIRETVNYEGQGAVELEQKARLWYNKDSSLSYQVQFKSDPEGWIIDQLTVILQVLDDLKSGRALEEIAYRFHLGVAELIVQTCVKIRDRFNISDICLGGGVFQNLLLLEMTLDRLTGQGFKTYIHRQVPTNDGGIALGQAVIANERSGN